MKLKKISKKLVLNKSTIVHLNVNELGKVLGGSDTGVIKCYTSATMCGISGCPHRWPVSDEWGC